MRFIPKKLRSFVLDRIRQAIDVVGLTPELY